MYSIIKNWVNKNKREAVLLAAILVAFFVYSFFYLFLPSRFNSPDETSNYFFIKTYVERGVLRVYEPLNFVAEGMIHPRSVAAVNGYLAPGGFLGIILIYGWLAKIFTLKIIYFLTPLFASFAVFCFYRIIEKIFNQRIAFWSALLLLAHPAFWYFSSRGLFPNVLFVSFLIIGFYFLTKAEVPHLPARKYINFILGGLFFGLALTVRLSEIIWVGTVLLALFLVYRKKIKWTQVALFLIFAIMTFSPIFAYNQVFYGSPFLTAYNLADDNAAGAGGGGVGWFLSFGRYVFPFGLDLKNILNNFSNYFAGMFWWLTIPLAAGVLIFVKNLIDGKLNKEQKIYLLLSCFIAFLLFCYYGSWLFYDNSAKEVSIGTSYVRYWLPIYILSLPFIVFVLDKLAGFFRGNLKKSIVVCLCAIYLFMSVNLIFFDKNDGLVAVRKNIKEYARIADEVGEIAERDAAIIVDRADKIFFPEYKVIYPLRDEATYELIPRLANLVPLYYYGVTLPQKDIDYLYAKKLDQQKVEIRKVKDFGVETLYKLELRNEN